MEENSGRIQSTLGEILSRLDTQAERFDRLSSEVRNLGQQVEMQQGSLDEMKRTQAELVRQPAVPPPPPPPPPILKFPQGQGQVTTVVPPGILTNHGPPLLTNPQAISASYGGLPQQQHRLNH